MSGPSPLSIISSNDVIQVYGTLSTGSQKLPRSLCSYLSSLVMFTLCLAQLAYYNTAEGPSASDSQSKQEYHVLCQSDHLQIKMHLTLQSFVALFLNRLPKRIVVE